MKFIIFIYKCIHKQIRLSNVPLRIYQILTMILSAETPSSRVLLLFVEDFPFSFEIPTKMKNIKLLYLLKPNKPQKLVPVVQKVVLLFLYVGCHFGAPNETQIWHLHTRLKKMNCNSHFFDNCRYQKPGRQKSCRN